jgi:hypothetical protein
MPSIQLNAAPVRRVWRYEDVTVQSLPAAKVYF